MNKISQKDLALTWKASLTVEPDGVYTELKKRFKDKIRNTGCVGIDDKDKTPKDDCIIKSTYHLENSNTDVDFYYSNNTRIVTKIEWCNGQN